MEIGYRTLEDALEHAFDVLPHQRKAFAARLKYFSRMGFPQAVAVGRGVRARYGARDILELAVALELTDLGIPPVVVIARMVAARDALSDAAARAWRSRDGADGAGLWILDVAALADMAAAKSRGEDAPTRPFVTEVRGDRQPRRPKPSRSARIVLDPGSLFQRLEDGFGGLHHTFADAFAAGMLEQGRHAASGS